MKKITDYKLDNDGTLRTYIGNKLHNTHFNVDSMFQAEILIDIENYALKIVNENRNEVAEIEVKDAEIVTSDNKHLDTIRFMYYANNFNYNWIEDVWSDNTHMCKHIMGKWNDLNRRNEDGGTSNFFTLFMQLDDGNRLVLLDWIKKNYNG